MKGVILKLSFKKTMKITIPALSLILLILCALKKYEDGLYAEVTTNKGLIILRLAFEKTPMTAAGFVGLAEGTIKNAAFPDGIPYFAGTEFHRVVPGHVIQCGIPKSEKAKDPGYQFPNEIHPDLNHGRAGMVNMANAGPHTNGSQWCITLGDRSYLDGDYTVFGQVVRGLDVVFSIVQGDRVEKVKIIRAGKEAKRFRPTTESFQKMIEETRAKVKEAEEKKSREEEEIVRVSWPNASVLENGVKFVIVREGRGKAPSPDSRLKVAYTGKTLYGKTFVSTDEEGKPYWGGEAEPFEFTLGKTSVNPGFDAALAQMKKGEKRILIVPSGQAYGIPGFYAKERKGEKRFHISPSTLVVYEVEMLDIIK